MGTRKDSLFCSFFAGISYLIIGACSALAADCLLPLQEAKAATDIEFVLDISGSMKQKLGGETQIESARKALLKSLDEIPKNQMVAVRVYGHRIDQSRKEESCKDTELLIPFQEVNKTVIGEKIAALNPQGYTPIAYALQETRNDLYDVGVAREAERVIILLTDGEETCGGDPIAVLKQLKAEGFKLTVYSIGFNVNDIARQQLRAIADFTGGKYYDAKDAQQLNGALKEATQASVVIAKSTKTFGTEVRGGDSYDDAKLIEFDKEYRLDHHQQAAQYDYFYVELARGSEVTVTINTGEKGISGVKEGKPVEGQHPYGGAQLHGKKRDKLQSAAIFGEKFKAAEFTYQPQEDGRYYLLIGSDSADTHKDFFTFKITRTSKGDLDGEKDAGSAFDQAIKMEAKRYTKNFIGDADDLDVFSFDAKSGDKYFVGIVPAGKTSSYFTVRVLDEFRQVLLNENSQAAAGIKTSPFTIADDGVHFLEIGYVGSESAEYSLILKKVGSAAEENTPKE